MTGPGTEDVHIKAGLSGPAHPPKTAGEQFSILSHVMPSEAMAMRSIAFPVIKARPTLTQTVMARQRSSLISLVNLMAN